ncbi:MAG: fused MFS/spermidine synthase, partial [Phycisphaerae bacterium]|nr:fused MFS/spermidine synthase [Phycisphaerae bacterium]
MNRLRRLYLLVLVTITGASILALEVLGTRVIGTTYGSSLIVWAALLTVTLLCLAAGYHFGGRLADSVPRAWMLCTVVAVAGLSILLAPRCSPILEPLSVRLGLTWGAIASALIIFAVPLTLLAMAGPYVIRLSTEAVEGVGRTSGAVYAVSTIGSVASVLVVSLWMVPRFGTRTSLQICSCLLVAWATIGLALFTRGRAAAGLLLAIVPPTVGVGHEATVAGEL